MPDFAALTLNNYAAVAKTFDREASGTTGSGVFTWKERSLTIPAMFPTITFASKRGRGSSLLVQSYKVVIPLTQLDLAGNQVKIGQLMADLKVYVPDIATVAQRQDFVAFTKNLAAHASYSSTIVNGESYW